MRTPEHRCAPTPRACASAFSVGPRWPRRVLSPRRVRDGLRRGGARGAGRFGDLDNFRKLSTHEHRIPDWCAEGRGTEHRFLGVSKVAGWIFLEKPRGVPRPPPHAVRSIARGAWAPARRVGAPCAAACLRGHTTWLGGCGGVVRRGFPWCRAGARSRTPCPSPAGGGSRRSGASTVWCAGHACACAHTLRASACATAEGAGGASARHERAYIAPPWTGRG